MLKLTLKLLTLNSQTLPTLIRMCKRQRTVEQRVNGAETLAYLINVNADLQKTAAITGTFRLDDVKRLTRPRGNVRSRADVWCLQKSAYVLRWETVWFKWLQKNLRIFRWLSKRCFLWSPWCFLYIANISSLSTKFRSVDCHICDESSCDMAPFNGQESQFFTGVLSEFHWVNFYSCRSSDSHIMRVSQGRSGM